MRVGLVLGAGGYAGQAFHAGVLAALAEAAGWDPRAADVVVGTSAGAGVAAGLRAGLGAGELYARVRAPATPASLRAARRRAPGGWAPARRRALQQRPLPLPGSPALLARLATRPWEVTRTRLATAAIPRGTRSTRFIVEEARATLGRRWPGAATWMCAVQLETGERVAFGRAGAPAAEPGEAVAASCAVPAYFAPVRIGGHEYLDGAVHSPTNADLLAGEGLDLVLVSSPMSASRGAALRGIDRAARLHARYLLGREVAALRRSGVAVRVFQPCDDDLTSMGPDALDPACRRAVATRVRETALRRLERAGWLQELPATDVSRYSSAPAR